MPLFQVSMETAQEFLKEEQQNLIPVPPVSATTIKKEKEKEKEKEKGKKSKEVQHISLENI